MKRHLLMVSVIVTAAHLFCGWSMAELAFDHLEPTYLRKYPEYREVLLSKLGVTPFDCGRSIILPFSDTEASQSVYSKSINGRRIYYVTRISSERNLWDLTDGGRYPKRAGSVRTHRIDAELPEQTAKLLKQVWLAMLQGSQEPRSTPPRTPPKRGAAAKTEERFVLIDPSFLEFSIERPQGQPLVGVLNLSAGYAGKERTTAPVLPRADRFDQGFGDRLRMLVEVSEAVYEYCKAEPGKRFAIAKLIDQKVIRLLEVLK
jgi:hypothetical protein